MMDSIHSIQWLQAWYLAQCNDDWEHQYGVAIQSLDNPGWTVTIDLIGTALEGAEMEPVGELSDINHIGMDEDHNWLCCRVTSNQFVGAGGPSQLVTICDVFRNWVELTSLRRI